MRVEKCRQIQGPVELKNADKYVILLIRVGRGVTKGMLKLLIADAAEDFRTAVADATKGTYVVKTCGDGQSALELARSFGPDLLILDLMIPGVDGLSLVQLITQYRGKPLILATTRFLSDYVLESASRIGIDYMVVKPCNIQSVVTRLADLVDSQNPPAQIKADPRVTVTNLLLAMGFATNNKGYLYLREAIPIYAEDPQQAITKELYPAVAKRCGGGVEQVERAMRTAIQRAWIRRDEQIWKMYFTPLPDGTVRKPSNSEFISRIAELLAEH